MKTPILASLFVGLALAAIPSGFGQTVTSDPAGFVTVSVQANSDAVLAVPLYRTAAFKGVIQSISGNTITVAGTSPGWSTDQFVQSLPGQTNTYGLSLATGVKEGMFAKVTGNTANTVTVQFGTGDDFTGVKSEAVDGAGNGDHIDILPYWTPASLLPSTLPAGVLFFGFNNTPAGLNLASVQVYGHVGGGVWENQDDFSDASHEPLQFGQAYVLRNTSASAQSISFVGSVPMSKHRFRLATLAANTAQDIRFGYLSPIPETLAAAGLAGAGSPAVSGDQILVFNNNQSGFNKSSSQILEYDGTDWTDADTFEVVTNTFQFEPGKGYIFRKFSTGGSPAAAIWSDLQGYLQ